MRRRGGGNRRASPVNVRSAAFSPILRTTAFLTVFALLQLLYGAAAGTGVERFVIDQMTVRPAAWFIDLVNPSVQVQPSGPRLRAPGGGIGVLPGCEGADVAFLLMAAMAVAPIRGRQRLIGALVGTVLVFVLNQARVVSLFYAFRIDGSVFELLHGIVAPLMVIIGAGAFFVLWLQWSDACLGSIDQRLRGSTTGRAP